MGQGGSRHWLQSGLTIARRAMPMSFFEPIRTIEDVLAIEARPYAQFMPWEGIYEAISEVATSQPETSAITLLADDIEHVQVSWTYAELLDKVDRAATLFKQLAGDATPRVAMLLPAIPEGYATLWGAASVGTVTPINYLLRAEHIQELVQAARCNIVVALGTHPVLSIDERVADIQEHCPMVRHVLWVGEQPRGSSGTGFEESLSTVCPSTLGGEAGDSIAALFHTGGTTGNPKLAQHTHRNQLHSAAGAACLYGLSEKDVIVNAMPLFHVAGTIVFGLSTILAGGHIVLPSMLGLRNPVLAQRYWSMTQRLGATLLTATPTGIATLMAAPRTSANTVSVRAMLTGGAPLPPALALQFEEETGISVRNTFGMTECAGVVSIEPALAPRDAVSCGVRIPFTSVEIATAEGPASEGSVGVLRIRGPNVSPGYTEAGRNVGTFEDGWLVSGDLARVSDGRIHVTGRQKDVIIRNAHNIDPQLIEDALLKHPSVQVAAAVGQPDEYAGELPVAYVVMKSGHKVDGAELLDFLAQHIAERPAQPKRIDVLDALPQTAVGKVYKPALRILAIERVLRERLDHCGLSAEVHVQGHDEPQGPRIEFKCSQAAVLKLHARAKLNAMMLKFSVPWSVV